MTPFPFPRGPNERWPLGAGAVFAHRSAMGEASCPSSREAGFESPAVYFVISRPIKREPVLGPLILRPGRASPHQQRRA